MLRAPAASSISCGLFLGAWAFLTCAISMSSRTLSKCFLVSLNLRTSLTDRNVKKTKSGSAQEVRGQVLHLNRPRARAFILENTKKVLGLTRAHPGSEVSACAEYLMQVYSLFHKIVQLLLHRPLSLIEEDLKKTRRESLATFNSDYRKPLIHP